MGDFYDKTDYLTETKGLLKDRINSLGGSITSGTTFRDYLVWLDSLYEALDEKTITGLPDSLEGKCEQSGTPTPSSPQPINITTGRQVVRVCGKNLLPNNFNNKAFNNNTGVASGGDNNHISYTEYIKVKPNTTYTFSHNHTFTGTGATMVFLYREDKSFIERKSITGVSKLTFTTTSETEYINLSVFDNGGASLSGFTAQLEKGIATTYEEYKGTDYEINLGKNLADLNETIIGKAWNNATNSGRAVLYIPCKPNTDYTTSYTGTSVDGVYGVFKTGKDDTTGTSGVYTIAGTRTLTSPANSYWFVLQFAKSNITLNDVLGLTLQVEQGQATSYSPYKNPIYLGKIGTYQDYIFRNTTENPNYDSNLEEGQWYIHKEIGRVVLNGSEDWIGVWRSNNPVRYGWRTAIPNALYPTDASQYLEVLSNYYKSYTQTSLYHDSSYSDYNSSGICIRANNSEVVIKNDNITTSTDATTANNAFKTWLSTHNVELYYVLNTPTNTLIEDEELINQLNEIEIFTVISENFYN